MPDVGDILNKPIFGPRLLAMIGWMKSGAHCSYSTIETYMEDVLQVPVSRGYLAKLCTRLIADSLDKSYQELKDAIPQQEQLGSDETSFKNNGKKHWIWCIASRFAIREYVVEGTDEVQSYDMSQDYFRFMFADGVEPTNNHNEQQILQCVIDRMITQGTHSEAGQRYHERMWTALATCRKQKRNFFDFLMSSIEAKLNKQPPPSLLNG